MNLQTACRCFLGLALAMTVELSGQEASPINQHIEAAKQAMIANRRDEAIAELDKAVATAGESPLVLTNAGNLYATLGELERGREVLEQALAQDPNQLGALQGLARIQSGLQKPEEASQLLQKAIELDPANVITHLQLINLEAMTDALDLSEARVQQLELDEKLPEHLADYLRGAIFCLREKWREAADALERALPKLTDATTRTVANLRLSQAYEFLGQHDRRLNYVREVIKDNPDNAQFKWFEVQALLALKRVEEAVAKYAESEEVFRGIAKQKGNEQFLVRQAQMELLQQSQLPKIRRTYADVEGLLYAIDSSERIPDPVKKQLRAAFYDATGRYQEAQALRESLPKNEENAELTAALRAARQKAGQPDSFLAAMQDLDALRSEYGDLVKIRLVRAATLADQRPPSFVEGIKALANNADEYEDAERFQLFSQIGVILWAQEQIPAALDVWVKAAEIAPDNLDLAIRTFDAALMIDDKQQIMDRGVALRDLAGDTSAEWTWARAARIVHQVKRGESGLSALDQAEALIDKAIEQRDGWAPLYRLKGDVYVLREDEPQAAEAYARAIEMGSTHVGIHRALIRLYFSQGNLAETEQLLRRLPRSQWEVEEEHIRSVIKAQAAEGNNSAG